ncbi:Rv3654c family TadE-like protein [Kitasatospora sp. NPDC059463]|uniref:Rv3654c family TadE-like protein n=1 Tax=Kitasatospora sp. NPDC059463 TaxID=3346842 RepID=UPI00369EF50A
MDGLRARARPAPRRADTGSATVWLLAFVLLGCLACTAALSVGAVVGARHRAESAADLAALAAADRLLLDADGGCGRAEAVAGAGGGGGAGAGAARGAPGGRPGRLDREEDAVEVVAQVLVTGLPPRLPVGPALGRARAGPVRAPVSPTDEDARAALGGPGPVGGGS